MLTAEHSLRLAGAQIEAPVIERPWGIILRGCGSELAHEDLARIVSRQQFEMAVQHECPEIILEFLARRYVHRSFFQGSFGFQESSGAKPCHCSMIVREEPGFREFAEVGRECPRLRECAHALPELCQVWPTATLRMQPPSGAKYPIQVAEEFVVIQDPVKRCGTEHAVEYFRERKCG